MSFCRGPGGEFENLILGINFRYGIGLKSAKTGLKMPTIFLTTCISALNEIKIGLSETVLTSNIYLSFAIETEGIGCVQAEKVQTEKVGHFIKENFFKLDYLEN